VLAARLGLVRRWGDLFAHFARRTAGFFDKAPGPLPPVANRWQPFLPDNEEAIALLIMWAEDHEKALYVRQSFRRACLDLRSIDEAHIAALQAL
jgi:hypothetical protein